MLHLHLGRNCRNGGGWKRWLEVLEADQRREPKRGMRSPGTGIGCRVPFQGGGLRLSAANPEFSSKGGNNVQVVGCLSLNYKNFGFTTTQISTYYIIKKKLTSWKFQKSIKAKKKKILKHRKLQRNTEINKENLNKIKQKIHSTILSRISHANITTQPTQNSERRCCQWNLKCVRDLKFFCALNLTVDFIWINKSKIKNYKSYPD